MEKKRENKKKVAEDGKSINLPQGQNSLLSLNLREKNLFLRVFLIFQQLVNKFFGSYHASICIIRRKLS